ncbi:MAG TPA: GNAT family protein [Gemmatimonadaceae bacterium]
MSRAPMEITPAILEGRHVRLEPLALAHHADLCAVGLDDELWRFTVSRIRSADEMHAYIESALHAQTTGTALPFATIDRASGRAVGSTRFGNISVVDRRVEIGWTWLGRAYQRTALNTEAKYLMLRHAFEVLGCIRVELKTDVLNVRSRAAILRLGAIEEGILRRHTVTASGRVRDTVYYSILDDEWPSVKTRLEARLARG